MEGEYPSPLSTSHSSLLPYPEIVSYWKYNSKVHKDPIMVNICNDHERIHAYKSEYITLFHIYHHRIEYDERMTFYKNYTFIIKDEV